jgi:hypothetical protein
MITTIPLGHEQDPIGIGLGQRLLATAELRGTGGGAP